LAATGSLVSPLSPSAPSPAESATGSPEFRPAAPPSVSGTTLQAASSFQGGFCELGVYL
jgi:hypothetical protein